MEFQESANAIIIVVIALRGHARPTTLQLTNRRGYRAHFTIVNYIILCYIISDNRRNRAFSYTNKKKIKLFVRGTVFKKYNYLVFK